MFDDVKRIDSFRATEIKAVGEPITEKVNKYYQDSSFKELFKEEKYQRLFLRDLGTVPNYDTIEL